MNTILIICSLFMILTYTTVLVVKEGIPYSISATFFALKHRFWFSVVMLGTAASLLPAILEKTPNQYQWPAFLAVVGMIMVGVAPNFKDEFENKIHMTGAIMAVVFSQLWVYFMSPWWLFVWSGYILYTILALKYTWTGNPLKDFIRTKPMFWVEITALLPVYTVLFRI